MCVSTNDLQNGVHISINKHIKVCLVCPTQQHIKKPGVEVAGASGVLAHTDGRAGCRPSDGGGTGLHVGHK